jgi:cell wall-associated NlpC family hydrolase
MLAFAPGAGAEPDPTRPVPFPLENPFPLRAPRVEVHPGERAVSIARRYLGVPYRYGGASPSGFDCSGFTSYVWRQLGVELPHNAAAQFGVGRAVPLERIRPGDLVFFSGLGHVGMVVDRRRYIHSPQSGEAVEIAPLSERNGTIVGARRVLA